MDAPHLFVATPCYGGLVTQRYMQSTVALMQEAAAWGVGVSVELLGYDSLITRSRNTLAAQFLDTPGATHLLFVDADLGFEPEQVRRMLRLDEEVVAGLYPLKLLDWEGAPEREAAGEAPERSVLRYVGLPCSGAERIERAGFVTGLYAGTGFMLIRRSALLRLASAHPELRYTHTHTRARQAPSANRYALFDCMIEPETGHYLSEDYAFCRRWRDVGGRIWLDTQGRMVHVGTHEFAGDPAPRHRAAWRGAA